MKTQLAYCSACDQDVRIIITDEPSQDGHANVHDAEVVCLEIGERCTGSLCPIGATSPTVMAARLVRNGFRTVMQPVVRADCPSCGCETEQVIIDKAHGICTVCEGTNERTAGG